MKMNSPLVTAQWLNSHLDDPNLVVLDASVQKVIGITPIVYEQFICLPNSQHCDLDGEFHDHYSNQPHTMPNAEQFNQSVQKLGINKDSVIAIYDNQGIYSAPRAWWMFKTMGIDNVFVLDGGLPNWQQQGFELVDTYCHKEKGNFVGQFQANKVCDAQYVLSQIDLPQTQIIDARAPSRFHAKAPEPRPGLRSGHIPSSYNIHFSQLLDGVCYKNKTQLESIFMQAQIKPQCQLINSCGSGMTACIVMLAAYQIGFNNLCLYDGSWSEWGADDNLPIEV